LSEEFSIKLIPKQNKKQKKSKKAEHKESLEKARAWHLERVRNKTTQNEYKIQVEHKRKGS
jgi:hypothetical protein